MGKKSELQELKERQGELVRSDQDKATLAAKIAALELAESQRAQAEAQAAELARVQAARAALSDAEALAIQALQVLQDRLDVVQQSAAAVGAWSGVLPDQLFVATRNALEWLKQTRPEMLGLAPLPTREARRLDNLKDELARLQGLAKGVDGSAARDLGYTAGIKQLKALIASQEGSEPEEEPEMSAADLAYQQTRESAAKAQEGMAGLAAFFRKGK